MFSLIVLFQKYLIYNYIKYPRRNQNHFVKFKKSPLTFLLEYHFYIHLQNICILLILSLFAQKPGMSLHSFRSYCVSFDKIWILLSQPFQVCCPSNLCSGVLCVCRTHLALFLLVRRAAARGCGYKSPQREALPFLTRSRNLSCGKQRAVLTTCSPATPCPAQRRPGSTAGAQGAALN